MSTNQTEANKKWQEKNREKARYLRDRSTARSFIRNRATKEDLTELIEPIETRARELLILFHCFLLLLYFLLLP